MTLAEFSSLLAAHNCQPTGSGERLTAKCPAHDDHSPSLSVTTGADGRILVYCHTGCSIDSICAALGIKPGNLFPERQNFAASKIIKTYDYRDASGDLLFQVCRLDPKGFRQRRPDAAAPDGWRWNTTGVKKVLFRLPELMQAIKDKRPIYLSEGEKDVLALAEAGFAATCNPGGAGKWQQSYSETLRDADVIIIADKDPPGHAHAAKAANELRGVAATVKVIELPDVSGMAVKDAADYFMAGGASADLDEIARTAPAHTTPASKIAGSTGEPSGKDFPTVTAEIRGAILKSMQDGFTPAPIKNNAAAREVVKALEQIGRFYFHADLVDFETAMFFDGRRKRLERIRSDSLSAWLAEWLAVNRASNIFKFILSAIETAALSSPNTTGIRPETYWASRTGALYLSNGDGAIVKITAEDIATVDNGTDGVLFAAGRTLSPWKLTTPKDPFKSCALFRDAHCEASHGKDLLQLWCYSFATTPRSKPPLCATGEIGSGKTRTLKGIADLYGIEFVAAKVEEQLEHNFWPAVNEGGLFTLDNADTKCRWLADAISSAATDGCSKRRKLYTNNENVVLRCNSWLGITSANPSFANDAGVADRLLLIRMERKSTETSDGALTAEISANRDAGLSHIAETLQKALADSRPTPSGLNARHPDFAAFAVRIGRALGREADAIATLRSAEADKATFCLENDIIGAALVAYLRTAQSFTGTAADLAPKLMETDAELNDKLSVKRLGKRLTALWPHLEKTLRVCKRETDRTRLWHFWFKMDAEFAEFQTGFSQNL